MEDDLTQVLPTFEPVDVATCDLCRYEIRAKERHIIALDGSWGPRHMGCDALYQQQQEQAEREERFLAVTERALRIAAYALAVAAVAVLAAVIANLP